MAGSCSAKFSCNQIRTTNSRQEGTYQLIVVYNHNSNSHPETLLQVNYWKPKMVFQTRHHPRSWKLQGYTADIFPVLLIFLCQIIFIKKFFHNTLGVVSTMPIKTFMIHAAISNYLTISLVK